MRSKTPTDSEISTAAGNATAAGETPVSTNRPKQTGRRDFLRTGALLGLGLGLSCQASDAAAPSGSLAEAGTSDLAQLPNSGTALQIGSRRRLGRTELEIPDISFGTFSLAGEEDLVHHALDRGITHFDTAEAYTDGAAETTLGRALRGRRSEVTLTTKIVAGSDMRAGEMMRDLDASLTRLQTDYVDLFLNHAVDDLERVRNPEWAAFVDRAKSDGKIRYSGMSGHGPSLIACLDAGMSEDWLDAILVAYNYVQTPSFYQTAYLSLQRLLGRLDWVSLQPELPALLARAREAGVGVMAMKTLRGARHNDMRQFEERGATFSQAALRWVLADERVDGAVISMTSVDLIDEYVGASGSAGPAAGDLTLLHRYEEMNHSSQCIQGCGDCKSACPSEVPISEVLRFGMYDRDYGLEEIARAGYAELAFNASACTSCVLQDCLAACPTGVDIRDLALETHRRLS